MERSGWSDTGDLLDPHHHAECRDQGDPRPDAGHTGPRQLRSLARSSLPKAEFDKTVSDLNVINAAERLTGNQGCELRSK
jgi:hypothetical protein